MDLFNIKISMNTLLFDGHFIQKNEFIIQKNTQIKWGNWNPSILLGISGFQLPRFIWV